MTTLLADQVIGIDKMMLEGIDTSEGPLFSVSEMATFFFNRSSHWVRWLENCDFKYRDPKATKQRVCGRSPHRHEPEEVEEHSPYWRLMLDGVLLEPIRTGANARKYDLALIEKVAHALAGNGAITVPQLRRALMLVKIQSEMHEFLEETYVRPAATDTSDDLSPEV
jgi:hypothetical protein